MTDTRGRFHRSRAARLLARILAAGALPRDALARQLGVTTQQLERYQVGHDRMPIERQLWLVLLVLARAPAFAREAYGLRGQLEAELAYRSHTTASHEPAPAHHFRCRSSSQLVDDTRD